MHPGRLPRAALARYVRYASRTPLATWPEALHSLRACSRGYGPGSLAFFRRSAYLRCPVQLQRADLEGILGFLANVASLDFDELDPPEVLASLQGLVPCDDVTYQEAELPAKSFRVVIGIGPADDADEVDAYWAVAP